MQNTLRWGSLVAGAAVFFGQAEAQLTVRVSVDSAGIEANGASDSEAISNDGAVIAYSSLATNLVANDANNLEDVFVRALGATSRVSISTAGVEANGNSYAPALSSDGRFVVFTSQASNLVAGDANNVTDAFVRDRLLGLTERVSVDGSGLEANGASNADGVSADGRYVVFGSDASNLVASDTNGFRDIFLRDRLAHRTYRVSLTSTDAQLDCHSYSSSISADGRYIAFQSASTLLLGLLPSCGGGVNAFVRDRQMGTTTLASLTVGGQTSYSVTSTTALSADGRHVAFGTLLSPPLDPNYQSPPVGDEFDAYVRHLDSGTTSLVNVDANGGWSDLGGTNPAVSSDGSSAVASSIFGPPYLRNFTDATTVPIAVSSTGLSANGPSSSGRYAVSGDGRFVVFWSSATNLVAGDTNGVGDIFLRDTRAFWTDLQSGLAGSAGVPSLTASGLLIPGELVFLNLSNAHPFAISTLVVGVSALNAPFKGGVMVPSLTLLFPFTTSFLGVASFGGPWPAGIPSGFTIYFQWWVHDSAGPNGFAASNAVAGTSP